ncbi:MAG TPA: carboxypeptidase-like regulatory domain-containing protein, partial [Thermoanaerobaculia bacterium]
MRVPAAIVVALLSTVSLVAEPRSAVQLRFVTESGSPVRVTGTLRVADASTVDDGKDLESRQLNDTEAAIVSAPLGSKRRIALESESWWMAPLLIDAGGEGMVRQDVRLWNAAALKGRFVADRELPKSFEIFIESPPNPTRPSPIPRNTMLICPLAGNGEWSCRVPAATLDLALRVPGFAPAYRWDTDVPKTGKALGSMTLRPGASVTAWIDRKISRSLPTPARAELHVLAVEDASPAAARLRRPAASAAFDRSGQVQLTGLGAGVFVLRVTAAGFAETTVYPVTVHEGRETSIRKVLELQRPFTLELALVPPSDSDGQPWDVELRRANDHGSGYAPQATAPQRSDASGVVRVAEQSSGRYKVVVRDRSANKLFNEDIAFGGRADQRQTIRIDANILNGTLSLGGKPLAAAMWFGGKNGAVQVRTRSDADGRFSVRLPHRDRWLVEIEEGDLHAKREVSWADGLEIDLPDNAVSGIVTRSDGASVPGAVVQVFSEQTTFTRLADDEGRFTIVGISTGRLQARDGRTGEVSRFVKAEPGIEINLVIEEGLEIDGVVIAEGRPVIGARVSVYGLADGSGNNDSAVTDSDGRFRVQVSSAATSVIAIVGAPGRVLQTFALDDARPAVLNIHPAGGNLALRL